MGSDSSTLRDKYDVVVDIESLDEAADGWPVIARSTEAKEVVREHLERHWGNVSTSVSGKMDSLLS